MKKKISLFMIGTSMAMLSIFAFMPSKAKAQTDDWDNIFTGNDCADSGAYCWGGPTE